jgi:signal transduction histidine kinase
MVIQFSDNGIGMELTPERERKIFDMYGRLSGVTEGKGFGLYLVKTQVEAMEGKISVESEKDLGTTFTISFPLPS